MTEPVEGYYHRRRRAQQERAALAVRIREEYEAGASLRDLADRHGAHYTTMRKLIQQAGGALRRRGARGLPA